MTDLCPTCGHKMPTPGRKASEMYIEMTEALYGVKFSELKKPNRSPNVSNGRGYLWFLLCVDGNWSLTEAAYKLSEGMKYNFNHTSVLHQVRKFANQMYGTPLKASLKEIRIEHNKAQLGGVISGQISRTG
jgi:chromosomal replication initiation ATPase DnaA